MSSIYDETLKMDSPNTFIHLLLILLYYNSLSLNTMSQALGFSSIEALMMQLYIQVLPGILSFRYYEKAEKAMNYRILAF